MRERKRERASNKPHSFKFSSLSKRLPPGNHPPTAHSLDPSCHGKGRKHEMKMRMKRNTQARRGRCKCSTFFTFIASYYLELLALSFMSPPLSTCQKTENKHTINRKPPQTFAFVLHFHRLRQSRPNGSHSPSRRQCARLLSCTIGKQKNEENTRYRQTLQLSFILYLNRLSCPQSPGVFSLA